MCAIRSDADRPRPITPLKRAFFESGVTQRAVAERIGMDEGQLSRIVNGLHAPDGTRRKIAKALGRHVNELWPDTQTTERAA